jgi:uncharacterized membrane protein
MHFNMKNTLKNNHNHTLKLEISLANVSVSRSKLNVSVSRSKLEVVQLTLVSQDLNYTIPFNYTPPS